jgi:pimeloyl-ACP methyl ester carboxylesterase
MPRRLTALAGFLLAAVALSATAEDVVVDKAGFKIQGKRFKENQVVSDPANGVLVQIPATKGFDVIEQGAKWTVFSSNTKALGLELKNLPDGKVKEYTREVYFKARNKLPGSGTFNAPPFDKDWKRTIHVKTGGGNFQNIEQKIAAIGPERIVVPSTTHNWVIWYSTKEWPPQVVRNLLATHPELSEPENKPDVTKRLQIVQFFRDAGNYPFAREELKQLKALVPAAWTKEQTELSEKLNADLTTLELRQQVEELELSINAGRYDHARRLVETFNADKADPTDTKRLVDLKATAENTKPKYDRAVRLLRAMLDELTGRGPFLPHAALGGGAALVQRGPAIAAVQADLAAAGEGVLTELHPDAIGRVELFLNLATQAENQRKAGKPSANTTEQLIALAVTGWLLGKNGADPSPDNAILYWSYRTMLLDYQVLADRNARRAVVAKTLGNRKPPFDLLAQLIPQLPPPAPGPVPPHGSMLKYNTGPLPEAAAGVNYVLRLPPEYHPGRAYPLVVALPAPGMPPENFLAQLAPEADRYGFILAAAEWAAPDAKPYDYTGRDHYKCTAVVRDILRHYRADNDRIFALGYSDGANLAMDVAISRPDLFAGVVAMGPSPRYFGVFIHTWKNAQKLPVYVVTGNMGGGLDQLRKLYEQWMPLGFPATMAIYRGRGNDFFFAEVPTVFDWMNRRKRITGTAALRLNAGRSEAWQIIRDTDTRYYWVGTNAVNEKNTLAANGNGSKSFIAAEIAADIRPGNQIVLTTRGLNDVVVWLDRDMIDWTKPLKVQLNGQTPHGYKPKIIEPDLEILLEELYRHGDRSMLFLNRLEFPAVR